MIKTIIWRLNLIFTGILSTLMSISAQEICPEVPENITFCGSYIDLTRYDMYERFDREQISFIYSHQRSITMLKKANRLFPIIAPILNANALPTLYLKFTLVFLSPITFTGSLMRVVPWSVVTTSL